MTVYVLMVWLVGSGTPLMFDAYTDKALCERHARVQAAKVGGTPRDRVVCASFNVVTSEAAE